MVMREVTKEDYEDSKYEEFRKFYACSEQREQDLIVTVQKLMIRIKELDRRICDGEKQLKH